MELAKNWNEKNKKRTFNALEIGAPISKESIESDEKFRATLGFDFIFTTDFAGTKRCYCIEVNGENSGIIGALETIDDPTQNIVASIRAQYTDALTHKYTIGTEMFEAMSTGDFDVSENAEKRIREYIKRSIRSEKIFENAESNLNEIAELTNDKLLQQTIIPEHLRPRTWLPGDDTESAYGLWIVKPTNGMGGKDIYMFNERNLEANYAQLTKNSERKYIVQEYIDSDTADTAPDKEGHAVSMRYLVDISYREDGTIIPLFETSYQRVAEKPSESYKYLIQSGEVEASVAVNRSNGALSYPSSKAELKLARKAAEEIIREIAEYIEN